MKKNYNTADANGKVYWPIILSTNKESLQKKDKMCCRLAPG